MTNDNYLLVHARETFKTTLTPDAKLLYMAMIATKRGEAFYCMTQNSKPSPG